MLAWISFELGATINHGRQKDCDIPRPTSKMYYLNPSLSQIRGLPYPLNLLEARISRREALNYQDFLDYHKLFLRNTRAQAHHGAEKSYDVLCNYSRPKVGRSLLL
jgi:hypothetical protein